ncbi:transposase [Desulfatitalea alkaliphila]|uniref:Transposase n=1 Tax=Desulfatitalea alkaliphila TaxID=2929485 RepID=A0AA41UKL2_9BACT|nr:transposase [Desulfatitalea alkaliphila]MCJ8502424.1 transposase [Desulfatitalea alkaliphila]
MPRQSRIDAPGAVHHIIARGIERGQVFRDDQDRDFFLKRFGELILETKTKCFAWALIPNHFHLLLKTGEVPIASVMRRLMTSYAISHNLRHHRSGHLFQNRYKSILCQQDAYLKQLVRYIHLNPLRAGLVKDADTLDGYRYCGHSALMGKNVNGWQSVDEVLALFGGKPAAALRSYRGFIEKGIDLGRQPELVGGGLVRSAGGWEAVRSLRKAGIFQKSDERILGDGDFVEAVLSDAREVTDKRYALAAKGVTFKDVMAAVSDLLCIQPEALFGPSKNRTIVKGRALLCYWVVRELGVSMTELADRLKIAVPTVSVAVRKGEKIAIDDVLELTELLNVKI